MPGSATPRKRGAAPSTSTTGRGWDRAAAKKQQNEENKSNAAQNVYDLRLHDGEYTHIQFLEEEPLCLDVHSVKIGKHWQTIPCQKATKRSCTLCDDNIKTSWKAAFIVLDFRGEWDKEKGKFKNMTAKGQLIEGKDDIFGHDGCDFGNVHDTQTGCVGFLI